MVKLSWVFLGPSGLNAREIGGVKGLADGPHGENVKVQAREKSVPR